MLCKIKKHIYKLLLTVLFIIHLLCAWRGVDYGFHWDQGWYLHGLRMWVYNLSSIPGIYTYGNFYYFPGKILLAPKIIKSLPAILKESKENPSYVVDEKTSPVLRKTQRELIEQINQEKFIISSRIVFALLSSLTIFWIFLAAKELTGSNNLGLLAAGMIALSWELNYHARHIEVNTFGAQFVALFLWILIKAYNQYKKTNIYPQYSVLILALLSGITASTKITNIFLIIPAIILTWYTTKDLQGRYRIKSLLKIIALCCMGLFITTPAIFLAPLTYFRDLARVQYDYNQVTSEYTYYVSSIIDYLYHEIMYLFASSISPYILISVLGFIITLIGAYVLCKKDYKLGLIIFSFPVFLSIFMGKNHQFLIRNHLPIFPIMAICFAIGFRELWILIKATQKKYAKFQILRLSPLILYLLIWPSANLYWMVWSAFSINQDLQLNEKQYLLSAIDYIKNHPQKTFFVSPRILAQCERFFIDLPFNTTTDFSFYFDSVVLYYIEHPAAKWGGNKPLYYQAVFSSMEVNYDYNQSWKGKNENNRICIISAKEARKMHFLPY